jgi:hypothetical protein
MSAKQFSDLLKQWSVLQGFNGSEEALQPNDGRVRKDSIHKIKVTTGLESTTTTSPTYIVQ